MKRLLIALLTVAVVGIGAYFAKDLAQPVPLRIPALGIEVECEVVLVPTSENLQAVVDRRNTAAWYGDFILDHAGQEFNGLWNIKYGNEVIFGDRQYTYAFTATGRSDSGLQPKDGVLPKADLYLCTCVPGGAEYEIYIIGINKK